jgi:hypothetical protein
MKRLSAFPLPDSAYVPGKTPRPQHVPMPPLPRGKVEIVKSSAFVDRYRFGIDLIQYSFFWEAHEALEGLWHLVGRNKSEEGRFLQILILVAGALLQLGPMGRTKSRGLENALERLRKMDQANILRFGFQKEDLCAALQSTVQMEHMKLNLHECYHLENWPSTPR